MDQELEVFKKKRKQKKIVGVVLTALLVVVLLGGLFLLADRFFFHLRRVTVSPSTLYTEEELIAACGVTEGQRLLSVDRREVERRISGSFPYLVNVRARLRLPDTLSVTFEEKMGEIALTLGDESYAVDMDLNVIARIAKGDETRRLGVLANGISRCMVGEKIEFFDEMIPEILSHVVHALDRAGMLADTDSLDLRDKFDLQMEYKGRFHILLGEDGDLDLKFAMVNRVFEEFYEEDTGQIDISDPNNAYVRLYNRNS